MGAFYRETRRRAFATRDPSVSAAPVFGNRRDARALPCPNPFSPPLPGARHTGNDREVATIEFHRPHHLGLDLQRTASRLKRMVEETADRADRFIGATAPSTNQLDDEGLHMNPLRLKAGDGSDRPEMLTVAT